MTAIIAGILAAFMIFGGIIPNYSNKTLEENLRIALNNPEKVNVRIYSTPSYKILGGNYDRVEITAIKPKFANIEFESLKIVTSPLKIDYAGTENAKGLEFIKNGEINAMLVLSPENMSKALNLNQLTNKINNFLSNFKLPIPMLSGNVSIDSLNISFASNRPEISGNFIAMGGLITAPFTLTGDLLVTAKNTVELYKPQLTIFGEPLIMDQIQDLLKFINPIIDVNQFNTPETQIRLKQAYFKDNKFRIFGTVSFNN